MNKYRGSLDSFVKKKSLNLGKSVYPFFIFVFIKMSAHYTN